MATARMFRQPPVSKIPIPKNPAEWNRLMMQDIERAEQIKSRHLPGLRAALASGNVEKHLRTLGIVSPACIDREFPSPK